MAKFDSVKDTKYKCDECKKEFKGKDIKLIDPADNISILTPLDIFKYVDKDGSITGGSEQPSKEKEDKILTCPHCNAIHLYGIEYA